MADQGWPQPNQVQQIVFHEHNYLHGYPDLPTYHFVSSTKNSHVLVLIAGSNNTFPHNVSLPQDANNPWLGIGYYKSLSPLLHERMISIPTLHSFAVYALVGATWNQLGELISGQWILQHGQDTLILDANRNPQSFKVEINDQKIFVNRADGMLTMKVNKIHPNAPGPGDTKQHPFNIRLNNN
ncbi:Hypothetical predicted protein [Paramuricea clavata]|uniref:Uncharacterized protein n=1 Tax=Paramuricea clavata TaxID=317549 RepID=A0A6S7KNG1_PARCT|nr:Hypothetical predicted protein [Paramuricea clavata]